MYVHVSKDTRRKLDYNTRKCRLVGYGGTNQWRAWDDAKKDVIVSRDVIFDEQPILDGITIVEDEAVHDEIVAPPQQEREPIPEPESRPDTSEINATASAEAEIEPRESQRSRKPRKFFKTRISTSQKQPLSLVEYNTPNPNPNQPHTGKLLSTRSTQRSGRMRQRKNMIQLFGMGHGF